MLSQTQSAARHRAPQRRVRAALTSTAGAVRGRLHRARQSGAMVIAAVTVTGVAVAVGVAASPGSEGQTAPTRSAAEAGEQASGSPAPDLSAEQLAERRRDTVSRGEAREPRDDAEQKQQVDARKRRALRDPDGPAVTRTEDLSDAAPRTIARALLPEYGFSASQFGCLDSLYNSESGWNMHADNPTSSAYGIPQALTSSKELPADYFTSAEAQIRWGLAYIRRSYGTPCAAWDFKQGHNFY